MMGMFPAPVNTFPIVSSDLPSMKLARIMHGGWRVWDCREFGGAMLAGYDRPSV